MNQGSDPRPLVTLAIFAYNQEEYIHEAVEAALAQTYEPLEIILSDDCSSDRTFEIMCDMAAAYEGRSDVRLRQSEINFGTALHMAAVAKSMRGELLVVAAGDDVSLPDRVEHLVDAWVKSEKPVAAVHSRAAFFDSKTGSRLEETKTRSGSCEDIDLEWYIKNKQRHPFASPTCAYSKKLFTEFPYLVGGSLIEDGPMAWRSLLKDGLIFVDEVLVHVRKAPQTSGTGYRVDNPRRWNYLVRSRMISLITRIQDIPLHSTDHDATLRKIERIFIRDIRRMSFFLIPESRKLTGSEKLIFYLRLIFIFPYGMSFPHRVYYVLELAGYKDNMLVRSVRRYVRAFKRWRNSGVVSRTKS